MRNCYIGWGCRIGMARYPPLGLCSSKRAVDQTSVELFLSSVSYQRKLISLVSINGPFGTDHSGPKETVLHPLHAPIINSIQLIAEMNTLLPIQNLASTGDSEERS
jgi:hypothetical protein